MRPIEPKSRFPVVISRELHRAFKQKCAREGRLMSTVIRELLEREVQTRKPAPKRSRNDFASEAVTTERV